jgi:hypothetical protein
LGVLAFHEALEIRPLFPLSLGLEPLFVYTSACSATSAVKFFYGTFRYAGNFSFSLWWTISGTRPRTDPPREAASLMILELV